MTYDRDPRYLHPILGHQLAQILAAIQTKLPSGIKCRFLSGHRTPDDQLVLFKKGRTFRGGRWVITDKGRVVTYKDGFIHLSRHNYLPATALDIGLFDASNTYLADSPHYRHIREGKQFGLEWGGDWTGFVDQPHLEIPTKLFFQRNIQKDCGYIWQQYLVKAGGYQGVLDGIFGTKSLAALKEVTGESRRNLAAWDKLYQEYGPVL